MADVKVQGVVEMSTEGAEAALNRVGSAAEGMAAKMQSEASKAGAAVDGIGSGADGAAEKFSRAESRISDRIRRTTTSLEQLGKTASQKIEIQISEKGLDRAKFEPALQKLRELEVQALKSSKVFNESMGVSSKQYANAMRQIPAQFTDVVTQLAGGQNPMLILLQQGGQLKDVFGGIKPMLAGVGTAIGSALTNPVTLAAAAVGTLAYEFYAAESEISSFHKALITTGGYSGQTADSLARLADVLAQGGLSHSGMVDALTAVASSGKIPAEVFEQAGKAVADFEFVTGQKAPEITKMLEGLFKDPAKESAKLNEQYNYLSASVYAHIASLEDQGKKTEAAKLAMTALADATSEMQKRSKESLSILEMSWRGFGMLLDAISGKVKSIFDNSATAKLAAVQAQIASLESQGPLVRALAGDSLDKLKQEESTLRAKIIFDKRTADWNAGVKQQQQDSITAQTAINSLLEKGASKQEKYNKAIADYKKQKDAAANTGVFYTKEQDQTALAQIRRSIYGEEKAAKQKSDPLETAYLQQMLSLSKDIAKSETAIANIRAGILETDGQHVAAMREWITFDKEGKKLAEDQKKNLIERATLADKLAVSAKNEADQIDLALRSIQARVKAEHDLRAIRATGEGARYTQVEDYLYSAQARKDVARDDAYGTTFWRDNITARQMEIEEAKAKNAASYLYSLDQQTKSLDQQIQLLGLSTYEQEKQQSLWQAEEAYRRAIVGLSEEEINKLGIKTAYLQQQAEIERASATRRNFDRDPQAQSEKALRDYADEATNLGAQVSEAWKGAFSSMEDALTEFATTGKLSFKDMADQIIADLLRIQIRSQITGPLSQMMSGQSGLGATGDLSSWIGNFGSSDSYFSSSGSGLLGWLGGLFGGARAEGGPVSSGSLYRVNERGPELLSVGGRDYLMMGSQSGSVTPNHQLGGKSVNVRISQSFAAGTDKKTADQAGLAAARAINRAQRRNG